MFVCHNLLLLVIHNHTFILLCRCVEQVWRLSRPIVCVRARARMFDILSVQRLYAICLKAKIPHVCNVYLSYYLLCFENNIYIHTYILFDQWSCVRASCVLFQSLPLVENKKKKNHACDNSIFRISCDLSLLLLICVLAAIVRAEGSHHPRIPPPRPPTTLGATLFTKRPPIHT